MKAITQKRKVLLFEDKTAQDPENFKEVTEVTVVKCAIRKALNLTDPQFAKFYKITNDLVHLMSRMTRRASLILAYHCTRMAEMGGTLLDLYKMPQVDYIKILKAGLHDVFPPDAKQEVHKGITMSSYQVSFMHIKDHLDKVVDSDNTFVSKQYHA